MKAMKRRIIIAVVLAVIIVIIGFVSCQKFITALRTIETAENVKDTRELPDWLYYLPASAKNISYCKVPLLETAYEYEVGEEEFLKWAEENDILLTPVDSFSRVFRYLHHLIPSPDTNDPNQWDEYESKRMATVKQGYEYHTEQDNGGGLDIVYDSEEHKAYYYYSFR